MPVRITIVGCSGSFPGAGSPASCYLVEAEGFRMLMDLGSGGLGEMQRYADLYEIDAVCLSHLHADHCLDVCGYAVARTFSPDGPKPRIPVYGPAQAEVRLGRALAADPAAHDAGAGPAGDRITDAFDFVTITPGTFEIGPLRVTAARMNHPVETHGFRLEHAGRSLAYSADTGETDALVGLARGADVLLSEASFVEPNPSAPPLPAGLHLTARQAGEHAARAGAGQLVLTHLVPWNDRNRSLDEAGQTFRGPLSLAAPGLGFLLD
jgi:ribonuclease BN (tRNA processing enzyme)